MKKITLASNKTFLKIWLIFHASIFLFFLLRFFSSGMKIHLDSDLFNMLPKSVSSQALSKAEEKLSKVTGDVLFILAAGKDFENVKRGAEILYKEMASSSKFQNLSFYQDMGDMESVLSFIQEKASYILPEEDIELLNQEGGADIFSQNALGKAYGAFTMTSLSSLEEDPFMLSENALENYLSFLQASGTSMSLKDGLLSSYVDDTWYVMIKGELSKEGSALASKSNGVEFINRVTGEIASGKRGLPENQVRFVFSGTPFHSYKASTAASKEISIISTVSMLAVILVLLFVFRSPAPILWSLLSISLSAGTAFMASISIFGKMHLLTLVFGTSLIGTSIDYSLHYFINWKAGKDFSEGSQIRLQLFKGLFLSLLSTILCYFILLFTPFSLLRQMSVFSIFGITSTFLTSICIYPLLPLPQASRQIFILEKWDSFCKRRKSSNQSASGDFSSEKNQAPDSNSISSVSEKKSFSRSTSRGISRPLSIVFVCLLFSLTLILLFAGRKNIGIENNLSRLYKMEGQELKNEIEAAKVLKYSPSAWFIVSGQSPEEVLEREEDITSALKKNNEEKGKSLENASFICTSAFVPSIKSQKKSREAAKKLLPLAKDQYLYLGYDQNEAENLSSKLAKSFEDDDYIEIGKNVPDFLETSFSSAWLGQIDGKFYSVILPSSVTDFEAYKALSDDENVFLVSKVQQISSDLNRLSHTVMLFFILVYFVIFFVLKIFYPFKQCFKIVSVPLLIVLSVSSIFAVSSIKLEFFSITGMILVFGLGLDYVIYMIENQLRSQSQSQNKGNRLESFAIFLSFFTTLVSFGALALSHFVPVHMIGLSIFIGLCSAYLLTFLYSKF